MNDRRLEPWDAQNLFSETMNYHSNYERTECESLQIGSNRERIAATNAANVQYAGRQSVERAPGSQQEPTFDGVQSDFLKNYFFNFFKTFKNFFLNFFDTF